MDASCWSCCGEAASALILNLIRPSLSLAHPTCLPSQTPLFPALTLALALLQCRDLVSFGLFLTNSLSTIIFIGVPAVLFGPRARQVHPGTSRPRRFAWGVVFAPLKQAWSASPSARATGIGLAHSSSSTAATTSSSSAAAASSCRRIAAAASLLVRRDHKSTL